ncbi:MAG: cupin domain-containing protein [Clostridiales bacterium]|nr:cupin domain-containing protein [Clostridiales bacterium]MCD8110984.1 cupin domain-containing protein [Clostridiales bacterium]MCD8134159.1 cupin domain-containing protein [Clostridiales bacterium]
MAGYKITKKEDSYTYTAPGHLDCKTQRLHDPQDVDGGRLVNGITYFLPFGGGTEMGKNPAESIYYIKKGTMKFTAEDGTEAILTEGDSVHIASNYGKMVTNVGAESAEMVVILLPPAK